MSRHIQNFTAPDGTGMVILTAVEFERLKALAEENGDIVEAEAELTRIETGAGTMPADVLDAMLDEGLTAVAAWRKYRGISQVALARKAGLSQVFVSKIERGENHGSPKTRRALTNALDAPLWALEEAG